MVGVEKVLALIAVVAVHAVRIDHEIELLAFLVHHIKQLKCVLMVQEIATSLTLLAMTCMM